MNIFPYPITVEWSEDDEAYLAEVPLLRTCIAYGDTPEEAVREVQIAAEATLEVLGESAPVRVHPKTL